MPCRCVGVALGNEGFGPYDPTPVPLWRQPMIHFAPTRLEQEDESAGRAG